MEANNPAGQARMEIAVYPLGTGNGSITRELSVVFDVLDAAGLPYEVTVMGTIVEGPLDELFNLGRRIHEVVFASGVNRELTLIKIDQRRE